jgi:maleylacetate reductase
MNAFVFSAQFPRVVFGAGSLQHLEREMDLLGVKRALVLSTPEQQPQADDIARRLGARAAGVFSKAVMHTPIESVQAGREEAKRRDADVTLAVGGGSTVGLAKGIALEAGLPIIAVPTTYAGSEMTPILGITADGIKKTQRDMRLLPKTVIYDPALTLSLPAGLTATSAMNAIAHCMEALYAQEANPVISMMAEDGIRALARGLPHVMKNLADMEARGDMLYGAWLAGASLGAVGMALHHKLCHTLGGSFNLPHAETHTVVLPHSAAYNTPAAEPAMARVSKALGLEGPLQAACGLYDLAKSSGAPVALKNIGMREEDLDRAAEIATLNPYYNPRPIEKAGIRRLLDDAFYGRRPTG